MQVGDNNPFIFLSSVLAANHLPDFSVFSLVFLFVLSFPDHLTHPKTEQDENMSAINIPIPSFPTFLTAPATITWILSVSSFFIKETCSWMITVDLYNDKYIHLCVHMYRYTYHREIIHQNNSCSYSNVYLSQTTLILMQWIHWIHWILSLWA